jgi:hypothetical protein
MLWGTLLASLILFMLVGYAAYQIMVRHPITSDITRFDDTNYFYLSRKSVFSAAIFAVLLAASCILCIKVLHNDLLIFLVPTVIIVAAGQAGALVGFAIQTTAGLALGIPIYRRLRGRNMPSDFSLAGLIFSWFLGATTNTYIVWIALHWPVNYSWAYFAFFLGEILFLWRPLTEVFAIAAIRAKSYRFTPGQWAVLFWTIFMLPFSLLPTYMWDECVRHIFFPKQVALFGQHMFDPRNGWAIDSEVFAQSYYTISYLLGGEYALRLANLTAPVAALLLLEDYCRRTFGLRTALCTLLVLVSTPFLGVIVCAVNLETMNVLSVTAMMIVLLNGLQCLNFYTVFLSLVMAAIAYLYKQQAVFLIAPVAVIILAALSIHCLRQKTYRPMIWLVAGVLSAMLIVSPFLIENYCLTKNPLFPWWNGLFHSEWLPPVNMEGIRYDHEPGFGSIAHLTFHGEQYVENGAYLFGINFFALAWFMPLAFFARKNMLLRWLLFGLFAASVVLWWKITSPNIRYFIGPLAVGSILLGMTMDVLWEHIRLHRLSRILALMTLAAAILIQAALFLYATRIYSPYPLVEVFTRRFEQAGFRLPALEEIKKVFMVASYKFGKESNCLLVSSPFLCLADQRIEMLHIPQYGLVQPLYYQNYKEFRNCKSEEEVYDWIFRKRKYACIIMPLICDIRFLDSPRFREMVNIEFSHVGYLLLTPKADDPGRAATGK